MNTDDTGRDDPMRSAGTAREEAVAAALAKWQRDLADLTGRNSLLYYLDLKVSTLDLSRADGDSLRHLLAGDAVRLSDLYPAEGDDTGPVAPDALHRVRTIRRKAVEYEEERGLNVAHVAVGLARWTDPDGNRNPTAPVVLRQVVMQPLTAAHRDFTLSLSESLVVNPLFLHVLRTQTGIALDADVLHEQAETWVEQALHTVDDACADLPGWELDRDAVRLANFQYAKQPLVQDLAESLDLLADHDLVAALVGDPDAIATVHRTGEPPPADYPDHVPPASEYLVLDADSSQSHAINAVLSGGNLVIQGPPGTGKSQTIANLMASLIAEGKTVLFVAEKRAAIDAVLRRLDDPAVDLGHLVMDLHDGGENRRRNAQELEESLSRATESETPADAAEADLFRAHRTRLVSHDRALHRERDPWGVSVFEAQAAALPDSPHASQIRLRGTLARDMDPRTARAAEERLSQYADLGGFAMRYETHPWVTSVVQTGEQAQQLNDSLGYVADRLLPYLEARLASLVTKSGLAAPGSVAAWQDALGLLERVRHVQGMWRMPLDDLPVDDWVAATASRAWRAEHDVRLPWRRRRALTKAAHSAVAGAAGDQPVGLHEALLLVARLRADCAEASPAAAAPFPPVPADLDDLRAAYDNLLAHLTQVSAYLPADDLPSLTLQQAARRVAELRGDRQTLRRAPRLNQLRRELADQGLAPLVDELTQMSADATQATATFRHVLYASALDELRFLDHDYDTFSGGALGRVRADFVSADRQHIAAAPVRVRQAAASQLDDVLEANRAGEALVRREAAKRRSLLPMRRLWREVPDVLLGLRPAWAMSPLVVSQVLPREQLFDVVIFDEASQVLPADAMPSIMRARQAVIAGDIHQLPPTTFFSGSPEEDEDSREEDLAEAVVGFESLLDLARTTLPERTLTWHYRSRDERLIAFSNAHIYHGTLTTFPGVHSSDSVRYVHVPEDADVPHGSAESSTAEVQAVVDEVLEHARLRPTESLGVIAFGLTHADRVDAALRDRLAEQPPEVQEFFAEGGAEPFLVKNLERVQGDERDAIILTVGYGKKAGRVYYRFGPLNQEGGERRLNVAVTRAKRRMTVVSALSAHDLDPNRLTKPGAQLLRQYLEFAESGGRTLGDAALTKPELNPFELDVLRELEGVGIGAVPQYGASGYRIDFALQHPSDPGRMVLALEADGATYHSLPTARDRDRLRQQHLENLGWRFHRIWSTDWFRDRAGEVEKIVAAYRKAVERSDAALPPPNETTRRPRRPGTRRVDATRGRGPVPNVPTGHAITDYSTWELQQVASWVRSDGVRRSDEQIIREMMQFLGFRRLGRRIEDALGSAVRATREAA